MALERFTWVGLSENTGLPRVIQLANQRLARWADLLTRMQRRKYRAASANTTLTEADDILYVDTSGGTVTVTLPLAASTPGKEFFIKKVAAANTLTVNPAGSDTIDGAASLSWTTDDASYTLYSVATTSAAYEWLIL